jgi:poly-gamma-glutamate synthesis protein (capsule biosynthesis protein)
VRRLALAGIVVALVVAVGLLASGDGADHDRVDGRIAAPAPSSGPTTTRAPATSPAPAATTPRGPRGSGQPVTFAFAGDVMFPEVQDTEPGAVSTGPPLKEQLEADPNGVLAPIAPVLSGADLTVVNLETAITDRGEPVEGKKYHFRSPATAFDALRAAGVDVVNMANNHALDYGPVGMQDTFDAIAASKLAVIGIGRNADEAYRPYRTTVKGQRIAVVSAVEWVEPGLVDAWTATDTQPGHAFSIDRTRLLNAVQAVRPEVDTVVVFMHWGTEETWCASPGQEELAQALIDAGADLVVGSHTHRVFGAGRRGAALVAYGLGNFVYWREDGESGRSGVLLVTATGREIDSYSWVPARITHGIPMPLTGAEADADVAEWNNRRSCSGLEP